MVYSLGITIDRVPSEARPAPYPGGPFFLPSDALRGIYPIVLVDINGIKCSGISAAVLLRTCAVKADRVWVRKTGGAGFWLSSDELLRLVTDDRVYYRSRGYVPSFRNKVYVGADSMYREAAYRTAVQVGYVTVVGLGIVSRKVFVDETEKMLAERTARRKVLKKANNARAAVRAKARRIGTKV